MAEVLPDTASMTPNLGLNGHPADRSIQSIMQNVATALVA